jgi:alkanesulfonate monooxygenase SsuD/methylene tetrahydromethanopterin reductase-like flavin-dependent oxidoreductase (luciferase family)
VKIGVLLPARFEDAGDYLADARALDAAGVDSLWLPDDGLDPWLVLSGIAAVTGRAGLVAPLSPADSRDLEQLGRRTRTLDRLSRGRLLTTVIAGAPAATESLVACARRCGPWPVMARLGAGGHLGSVAVLTDGVVVESEPAACRPMLERVREERGRRGLTEPFALWVRVAPPDGREHWRSLRGDYEAAGASGLIVPADPRLLDLLRNGDEEDDRSDLTLVQG